MRRPGFHTKTAIIDNSIDHAVYNPIQHWKPHLKGEWRDFRAPFRILPDLDEGWTHLILTGSEVSILEREDWVREEVFLVQEALEQGLSILGSCYGHQLLAMAICGPSHLRRCSHPEVGWIPVQINKDSDLLGKKRKAFCFSSHFDEVINLGPEFHILASSEHCLIQAIQWKKKSVWGIQMHPEISIKQGKIFLKNVISRGFETSAFFEEALKQKPKDSGLIHQIMDKFFS
ncbi:MAG: type 1 glutamine amidotransferase [Candidatus Aminicenantales bacterium]